ncbi:flavin reductase family protein [Streptomyces sp. Ru71]|uniref:flavin reductase family protein n=1 Tax=Streptomyces sp. Ru71 TaxID=2080746 RepID=UPI002156280B|nr:flavin reductase family protein [Streptomyces sp. Ru71]
MRQFATGVCVVSTYEECEAGRVHDAITVNSLTSVSLAPPLISLSFRSDSGFLATLMETQQWGISILDADSERTARLFARPRHEREAALRSLPSEAGRLTGALLFGASGWMECRYRDHLVVGDHVMVIGEVLGLGVHESPSPLIFLQGGFHRFEPQR